MANRPRGSHTIPRLVLKRFAIEGGPQIHVYDKEIKRKNILNINDASKIRDHYRVDGKKSEKIKDEFLFEKLTSEIETKIEILFSEMEKWSSHWLSGDNNYAISVASSYLMFRSPRFRGDIIELTYRDYCRKMSVIFSDSAKFEKWKREVLSESSRYTDKDLEDERTAFLNTHIVGTVDKERLISNILSMQSIMMNYMESIKWYALRRERPEIVLGDSIVQWAIFNPDWTVEAECFGDDERALLFMPLTSNLLLIGFRSKAIPMNSIDFSVNKIMPFVCRFAERWVFSSQEVPILEDFIFNMESITAPFFKPSGIRTDII